jgi:protein involved in polysaccharide export with SLBB domain
VGSRARAAAIAVALTVTAPGCATAQQASTAGATRPDPATSGGAVGTDAAARTTATVGPGDKIILRVWREPEWSDSLLVDEGGTVILPRIGRYSVTGITPRALQDSIQQRIAAYLRDPAVDVVVLKRIAVLGAVRKPNVYYVDPVTSLREVLAYAGGLDDTGDPNGIEIVRDGTRAKVGKWNAVSESAVPIRSGDQVIVSKRAWFTRNAGTVFSSIAVAASVLVTALRK